MVVIVAKQLGVEYANDVKTLKVWQDIQDWLYKRCLSLSDIDKSRFLVGMQTAVVPGIIRMQKDYDEVCKNLTKYRENDKVFNYLKYVDMGIEEFKYPYLLTPQIFKNVLINNKDKITVENLSKDNDRFSIIQLEFLVEVMKGISEGKIPPNINWYDLCQHYYNMKPYDLNLQ